MGVHAWQGLFQDFAQEGAKALWQISRGGEPNPNPRGGNTILNIGKPIAKGGRKHPLPPPPEINPAWS